MSDSNVSSERPDESYARRWLYVSLVRSDATILGFTCELGEWYLEQILKEWPSVEGDVSASWDASRTVAPAWSELDSLARGSYVGQYAAECAVRALGHLLEWDITNFCPDADDAWHSYELD